MATVTPLAGGSAPPWSSDPKAWHVHRSGWALGARVVFLALLVVGLFWAIAAELDVVHAGGFPFFFFFPGLLFGLLFLFWIGWALVRWTIRPFWGWHYGAWPYDPWGRDAAISIARQRYARGEISREEFGALVNDLASSGTRP